MGGKETINLGHLLNRLMQCSEIAAKIAQVFRSENEIFQTLIEEKSEKEINNHFVQDFKTLADVLVQVTIKKKLEEEFPTISSRIQGEEQNRFQNVLGESINVELSDSHEETVSLLSQVLDGNIRFAESIANIVHFQNEVCVCEHSSTLMFPAERIGIWIDPIDSTSEYIQAKCEDRSNYGIIRHGLKSVCVLIGVYDLETGYPVLGVINQPFHSKALEDSRWVSKLYWGVALEEEKKTSIFLPEIVQRKKRIVTSTNESETLQHIMCQKYEVIHVAGAGYKSLLVACMDADLYVLSQGSTYFWDTCGPHALLAAQGGGIADFSASVKAPNIDLEKIEVLQIKYSSNDDHARINSVQNSGGIIAYREPLDLIEFLNYLHGKI